MTYSSANYHLQEHTGVNYGKYYLIDESIRRTLKNTSIDSGYDTSYERLYYYVNPKDEREIAVIKRLKSPYRNYFDRPIISNFHQATPPEGAIRINDFQLSQMMKMHNKY